MKASEQNKLAPPDRVEQPEALRLFWTCRANNAMWEAGGVGDQPHLLMAEFMTCQRAEGEYGEEKQKWEDKLKAMMKK